MPLFTSQREKLLWLYAFIVLIAITVTLVFADGNAFLMVNQNIQIVVFWIAFILIGLTTLIHGLKTKPHKLEIVIWFGVFAVYLLLFLRLGHAERSHLMEYSILAIFIHKALIERNLNKRIFLSGLFAFLITFSIGFIDELIQLFIPSRVFDPIDILFNTLAAFMTITTSLLIHWIRKKFRKNKES